MRSCARASLRAGPPRGGCRDFYGPGDDKIIYWKHSSRRHEAVHDPKLLRDRLVQLAQGLSFEVTSRAMMGGFIGYADGRTFVSISTGGLGIRLVPPAKSGHSRGQVRPGCAMDPTSRNARATSPSPKRTPLTTSS